MSAPEALATRGRLMLKQDLCHPQHSNSLLLHPIFYYVYEQDIKTSFPKFFLKHNQIFYRQ